MSDKIKKLMEDRASAWAKMLAIKEEGFTADNRATFDRLEEEVQTLGGDIERITRADKLEQIATKPVDELVQREMPRAEMVKAEDHERAFNSLLKRGPNEMSLEERRVLAEYRGTDPQGTTVPNATTAGGYLVPIGLLAKMVEARKAFGGTMNLAEPLNTADGQELRWVTHDGTAQVGRILAEQTQLTVQDMAWGQASIKAYMYTSDLVLVSLQLIQDSLFDVAGKVAAQLGERVGRILAAHSITGNGTTQPEGIATNATAGATGAAGSGTTPAVTYAALLDLVHSIDPAYRAMGNCRFIAPDSWIKLVRLLKDDSGGAGLGRPLWEPALTAGAPDMLLGYPITTDQNIAAPGVSTKSALFGDFNQAYVHRSVNGAQVKRLEERYADYLQVGFFSFERHDAKVQNTAAYRSYVMGT